MNTNLFSIVILIFFFNIIYYHINFIFLIPLLFVIINFKHFNIKLDYFIFIRDFVIAIFF